MSGTGKLVRKRTFCSEFFIDAFTLCRKFSIECISDLIALAKSLLCCIARIHCSNACNKMRSTPSSLCTSAAYAPSRRSVDQSRPGRIRPAIRGFSFFSTTTKQTNSLLMMLATNHIQWLIRSARVLRLRIIQLLVRLHSARMCRESVLP